MKNRQTESKTGFPSVDKPWLKYYSEEALNASLPECSIYEYLVRNNRKFQSDIAIIYLGRKITYRELFVNIDKAAAAFLKAGVKEKEIVTVALPCIPEALYCVYALNRIGAVANMIHPLAGKDETLFYLREVGSRIAVIFDGAYDAIANDIGSTSVEKVIVASPADSLPFALKIAYGLKVKKPRLDGAVFQSWKAFIQDGKGTAVKTVKRDCHEMAVISHTGGTTGEPKGCMISDHNILSEILQITLSMPHSRQERMMAVLPPFVNYSLVNCMLEPLSIGFTLVLIPKYEPEKFAEYVTKYHVQHMNSIPAYWEAILKIKNIEKYDLSSLFYIFYGGEEMASEIEQAVNDVLKKCGVKTDLKKGLGMTELTSAAAATYDAANAMGSVGIPLVKTNCKIVNIDSEREMTYDQDGEICFSGPTLMLGYYHNQEETDKIIKLHPDGKRWLHTGDLGHITEDGIIYVTGRIKRIIMTRGRDGQPTKLFPDRVEKALYSHQSVELCCVIGVPDKERIHYPKAFIVLKSEADADLAKSEILEICKRNLPEYMVPEEIVFIDEMPRTPRGKIDFRVLEQS